MSKPPPLPPQKEQSPFSPGRPVPLEFFVGRREQIQRLERSARQVAAGKQENVFITGEYGIGKSSLAAYSCFVARERYRLAGFHVFLSGASTVEQMVEHIITRIIRQAHSEKMLDRVRSFLGRYIDEVTLFGVTLNLDSLRHDTAAVAHNFVPFLRQLHGFLGEDWKGIALILDDLNGITAEPAFAHLLKSTVDEIATSRDPLPLLLILVGVPERREDILRSHQSVERIFDIAEITPLDEASVADFFRKTFSSVGMAVDREALECLTHYSGGLPKLMHELGDATFWCDDDRRIDGDDAFHGVVQAAENVGRKYFDSVYRALQSTDYRSILHKLGEMKLGRSFRRADATKLLTAPELRKFDNFLQRMKKLGALGPGHVRGEYAFPNELVRVYLMTLGPLNG